MTKQIQIGDVLQINATHRLTYVGGGHATMERVYKGRTATGGFDPAGIEAWKADDQPVTLTGQQTAFWLSKR